LRRQRRHAILPPLEVILVIALVGVYVRVLLRRGSTWVVVAFAAFAAMVGISLDLFAFDRSSASSVSVVLATFEIAAVMLAVGGRLSGIASGDAPGFRSTVVQSAGFTATELGATVGAGAGSAIASWPVAVLFCVIYNLLSSSGVDAARLALTGIGLGVEATVAAAWAGLGARVGGRVAGAATGVAAFAVARLDLPKPLLACLPAPLPSTTLDLVTAIGAGALAVLGLGLVTGSLPGVEERAP